MQRLPRSLVGVVEAQLQLRTFQHAAGSRRSYATGPTEEEQRALQMRQLRLAEKAGRMKQNVGQLNMSGQVFANIARPPLLQRYPVPGRSVSEIPKAVWRDIQFFLTDYKEARPFKAILGKDWRQRLFERSFDAYKAANEALASGNVAPLVPLATQSMIDQVRSKRMKGLTNLRMSWKLHDLIKQDVVCVRQQSLAKPTEKVAQVAIRFETTQSLEVRDAKGTLIGKGRHTAPEKVTEIYVFQRDMWREGAQHDWKMVDKIEETLDPLNPPIPM